MILLVAPNHDMLGKKNHVETVLDQIHELYKIDTLIVDESPGACFWASMWATHDLNITVLQVSGIGHYSTLIDMFEKGKPTHILAFVGDKHTADAIEIANRNKVEKLIIR